MEWNLEEDMWGGRDVGRKEERVKEEGKEGGRKREVRK